MKVDWRTHPNNVGHFYFQGCFRCHDGNHLSKDGKAISKDCNACHTMLSEQEGAQSPMAATTGITFKHPVDLGDLAAVNCSDCHNGGVGPYSAPAPAFRAAQEDFSLSRRVPHSSEAWVGLFVGAVLETSLPPRLFTFALQWSAGDSAKLERGTSRD